MSKSILVVAESLDINKYSGAKANFAFVQNLFLAGFSTKVLHYSRKKIDFEGLNNIYEI